MKWLILGAALALTGPGVSLSEAETAREILDAARDVNLERRPDDVSQKMRMTLVDSRGSERVRDLHSYAKEYEDDTTKTVTFFEAPPEVRGVGFLSWSYPGKDADQWLYLPALKRVRRITADNRRQSFQGSDFTYEDLELFDEMPDWTEEHAEATLVEENGTCGDQKCTVIDLLPKTDRYEYGRFRIWLHREDATFRKMEFYGEKDGKHLKTLTLAEFREIDDVPTPHLMVMESHRKGSKTVIELSEVEYDRGLEDDVFTERTLRRGRVR